MKISTLPNLLLCFFISSCNEHKESLHEATEQEVVKPISITNEANLEKKLVYTKRHGQIRDLYLAIQNEREKAYEEGVDDGSGML